MSESETGPSLIGIGLLPKYEDRKRLIQIQRETMPLQQWQNVLNQTDVVPHLSLIHANVLNSETLISRIGGFVDHLEFKDCIHGKGADIEYVERGWYFLQIHSSGVLESVHRLLFDGIIDLIQPGFVKDQISFDLYSDSEKSNFLKYGYRYISSDFHPHVTLGRTIDLEKSSNHDGLLELFSQLSDNTITFDELIVFRLGKNGTMAQKLWGVDLRLT